MESRILRIAVVGAGAIGALHAEAVAGSPCAKLVAVCDPDLPRAQALARRFGGQAAESLLQILAAESPDEPLDAVLIATPDHLHVEHTRQALEAGKHVFCEKPLATTVAEAQAMVDLAAAKQLQLGVDYNRRYGFGYRRAFELWQSGTIGKVLGISLAVADQPPSDPASRPSTFMLTSLLTHHFDLIWWFGGDVERLAAQLLTRRGDWLIDQVSVLFRLRTGVLATLTSSYRAEQTRTWERMEISGTLGQITIDDVTREVVVTGVNVDQQQRFRPDPFQGGDPFYATVVAHARDFVHHLAQSRSVPVSGRDGLRGLEIVAAVVQSNRLGQFVEVPPCPLVD